MKACRGSRNIAAFLISALGGVELLTFNVGLFTPGKNRGTHWVGSSAVPKAHLYVVREEKDLFSPPGFEPWPFSSKHSPSTDYNIPASRSDTHYFMYLSLHMLHNVITYGRHCDVCSALCILGVRHLYKNSQGFFSPIRCNFDTLAF
jgi:hypothetical protein